MNMVSCVMPSVTWKVEHRIVGQSKDAYSKYLQLMSLFAASSSSSFDYKDEFKAFQEAETNLWRNQGIERPKEELVPASGNLLAALLAHRLHNPSFTTTKVCNGITADSSNPCTALVMANGFDDNTIMIDHVVRREVKDPFVYYPEDILACHEQHLSMVRNQMIAPVEVVYGVPTWKRTQRYLQGRLQPFDLWGSYKGIRLFLEWDSVEVTNRTSERQLKRFLIAAFHPQNLLRAWSNNYKSAQDTLLEVAYNLAEVRFVPHFFSTNLWQKQIDVLPYAHFAANKPSDLEARRALLALHGRLLICTNQEVRKRSTRLHARLTSDMEQLVSSRGQHASPEAPFTLPPLSPSASMTTIWPRKLDFAWSHLVMDSRDISNLPSEVHCLCTTCWGATVVGSERCTIANDPKPRWTKTMPPMYVERRLQCQTCRFRRRFLPIDDKIRSIAEGDISDLYDSVRGFSEKVQLERLQEQRPSSRYHRWQKPAAKTTLKAANTASRFKEGMPRLVQSEHLESRADKPPVPTECTLCHEKGPVNHRPQWLVGSDVYLARRTVKCMSATCIDKHRHWIPIDQRVQYITHDTFDRYVKKGAFSGKTNGARPRIKHRQNLTPNVNHMTIL